MPQIIDLTGKKFGRLTVVELHKERSKYGQAQWICRCDCGGTSTVVGWSLRKGYTKSCKCLHREMTSIKRLKDLSNQRFGRLTAISIHPEKSRHGAIRWICHCDCGSRVVVVAGSLTNKNSRSCGCLNKESTTLHGKHKSKEYQSWSSLKGRVTNPNNERWHSYGGRGIKMCDRWRNSFEAFYEDMGPRPSPKHSIDRIDNDGDYCPENCRWATHKEQQNNKRPNVWIEHLGEKITMTDYCRKQELDYSSFRHYYRRKGRTLKESTNLARRSI